jgi:hypothetical protein
VGLSGWYTFLEEHPPTIAWKKIIAGGWVFFWIINLLLLPFFSTMYSKKARVEAMVYLSQYENISTLVLEDSNRGYASMMPLFYLKQWPQTIMVAENHPYSDYPIDPVLNEAIVPDFVLFFDSKNLDERLKTANEFFPDLVFEKKIEPGLIDELIHWLNPINANQTIYIYRTDSKAKVVQP